ncbi:MAG: T9SS C-terminal target domain-containing protein [Saprospirales bacterium]|nr:MAG: T9SS C-terminal target domain-containing protein [Saprospirales bacterium]
MKNLSLYLSLLFVLIAAGAVSAQCDFEPEIAGDLMLCPESEGVLNTGSYDSYQWYKRPFSGGGDAEAIPGATDSFLTVNYYDDVPAWFSVEVERDTCVVRSEEVLLDGYAFLPPFVETIGDFTIGPNGETIICNNDSLRYLFSMDTSIQWYRNFEPIPGATDPELIVTEGGSYFAEGAPYECPEFIMQLGVTLQVDKVDADAAIPQIELEGYDEITLLNPGEFVDWQWYCEWSGELTHLADSETMINGHFFYQECSIGPFLVRGVDMNGCIAWSNEIITIINSVEERGLEVNRVYPNPATDRLLLEFPEDPGMVQYSLFDSGGQLVQKGELQGAQTKHLNIGTVPSGSYFIQLSSNGLQSVVQIQKVK